MSSQAQAVVGGRDVTPPAHTVFRPSNESRALVMRAQRAALEMERKRMLAARQRSKPVALGRGQVLGGDTPLEHRSVEEVRAARLLHLEQPARAPVSAASEWSSCRARRHAYEAEHTGDEICSEVLLMLDLLGSRLQSPAAAEEAHATLCTVLRNALTKGGSGDDPKYRTLRATNDKLWARLLRHVEMRAVLGAAGFDEQRSASSAAPGAGAVLGASTVPSVAPDLHDQVSSPPEPSAFYEGQLHTNAADERWVLTGGPAAPVPVLPSAGSHAPRESRVMEGEAERREAELMAALVQELNGSGDGRGPLPEVAVVESLLCQLQEVSPAAPLSPFPTAAEAAAEEEGMLGGGSGTAEAAEAVAGEAAGAGFDAETEGEGARDFELVRPAWAASGSAAGGAATGVDELTTVLEAASVWFYDP